MKKLLLGFAALSLAAGAGAQRLALYEEFSGENCAPCAASNPGLWTLISANPTQVMLIKYQSPIPSAGPIYNLYKTVTDARLTYYNVPFAPYGRLNGTGLGTGTAAPASPGHVANLTQSDITGGSTGAPAINLTVSHSWNATGDSVTATINISSPVAYAPAGANLKLRIALVEHLTYSSAPGTNGETDFHNVVREMYPNAGGTQLANSWSTGQTQTITIKGKVPYYVDKSDANTILVAWIQNDADKAIPQAAKSTFVPLTNDVSAAGLTVPTGLTCAAGSTNITPSVTIKNTGTTTLTSAKIYYKVDAAGTWQTQNWTGTLASGATSATINLTPVTVPAGQHVIYDSVTSPNGSVDINTGNSVVAKSMTIYNNNGVALPIATDFEATTPNWILNDANGNGENWLLYTAGASYGHNGSGHIIGHDNFDYPVGETNYAIVPSAILPAGPKALNFYIAYSQYKDPTTGAVSGNDKLEVVYSTNCGTSWTSIWNQAGAALATDTAWRNPFTPRATTNSNWQGRSIDISSIPAGAMVALRATSDFGNRLFVDDVYMRTGPTAVGHVISNNSTTLAPNPASGTSILTFDLTTASSITVQVIDAMGRVVSTPVNGTLQAGQQQVLINTENMAAGLYNIVMHSADGLHTERLSVVK